MESPSLELQSAESSQSEDAYQEQDFKPANGKNVVPGSSEWIKSPVSDSKTKGSHSKKNSKVQRGGASAFGDDGTELVQQNRKKRSRVTPSATDESDLTNGRKSVTEGAGKDGRDSLHPAGDGDVPVQGSLLEEVLAEKRMALMRSPVVMRFLQQHQASVQAVRQHVMQEPQQHELCVGELEEDAVS